MPRSPYWDSDQSPYGRERLFGDSPYGENPPFKGPYGVVPLPPVSSGPKVEGGGRFGGPQSGDDTGGGGGNGGGGRGPAYYPDYSFWTGIPRFTAPEFHPTRQFRLPTEQEAQNTPGYRFRLGEGIGGLERSAAGRGVGRTGGTLKDILSWGQNYAAQEYAATAQRALDEYNAQYGQERDVFDRFYTGKKDEYAPLATEWAQKMAMLQHQADLGWLQDNDWFRLLFENQNTNLNL
jgi:hypothetical protein